MAAHKHSAKRSTDEHACTGHGCNHHHHPDKGALSEKFEIAIQHGDHIDYVSDGHLYHKTADGRWEECRLEVEDDLPEGCSHDFECAAHHDGSTCGPECGHIAVPHGDHVDYLVPVGKDEFELHHPHGDHCDYHGTVKRAKVPPEPKPQI